MFKLFSEIDRADLYDGIDIDEATQQSIYDWYQYREVCDEEDKFKRFFRRKLAINAYQYNQLIRLQYTDFDPLVNSYHESLTQNRAEHAGSISVENTGNTSGSVSDNVLHASTETTRHTGTVGSVGNSATTTSEESTDDIKNLARSFPGSTIYPTQIGGGVPDKLDWTHASGQEETDSTGTRSSSNTGSDSHTRTDNLIDESTGSGSETGTHTTSGTSASTSASSTAGTQESATNYISTGRDGLTPQEALKQAMEYVKKSDAFDWLRVELEECFIMVYN